VSDHKRVTDTSPDAERLQLDLIRAMSPTARATRAMQLTNQMLRLAKDAIRRRHPEFTDEQVGIRFIELHYGETLGREVRLHLERRRGGATAVF
jgi:hypothetical protein